MLALEVACLLLLSPDGILASAPSLPPSAPPRPVEGYIPLPTRQAVAGIMCCVNGLIVGAAVWHALRQRRRTRTKIQRSAVDPNAQRSTGLGPHDNRVYEALGDDTIRLLRCSWLRSQSAGFVLKRRQDLPPDAFYSKEESAALFLKQQRLVCVLSYGWLTRLHCDPHGLHARQIVAFLNSDAGTRFEALFWDFGSLAQRAPDGTDRTEEEKGIFKKVRPQRPS